MTDTMELFLPGLVAQPGVSFEEPVGSVVASDASVTMSQPSDLQALEATRTFEQFYRDERDKLAAGLAASLGEVPLAAEAVDEAMVRAYQRWPKVSTYDNPAGWVYRVARNWAVSRLRRRRFVSDAPIPELSTELPIVHRELLNGLRLLPEPQRQVLVLKYLFGWSQEDIAVALKIRQGTVKSRSSRALQQLRIRLDEEDVL